MPASCDRSSNKARPALWSVVARLEHIPLDLGWVRVGTEEALLAGPILAGALPSPHPKTDVVRALHLAWAARTDLCDAAQAQKWAFWKLWTDCALERAATETSIIPDYCLAFTILDDGAEQFMAAGPLEALDNALRDFADCLAGHPEAPRGGVREYPKYSALREAWFDLGARLAVIDNGRLQSLFLRGFDSYRRGVVQQAYFARHQIRISKATQLYNRVLNVAYDPTIVLLCVIVGIQLPSTLEAHPLLERLHLALCRSGAVINDLISFPKELEATGRASTYQNMVAARMDEIERFGLATLPLEAAIQQTFQFHNREITDFVELGEYLVADIPALMAYVRLGLDMHRSWFEWCCGASRYARTTPTPLQSLVVPAQGQGASASSASTLPPVRGTSRRE